MGGKYFPKNVSISFSNLYNKLKMWKEKFTCIAELYQNE